MRTPKIVDTNPPRAPVIQSKVIVSIVNLISFREIDLTRIATPVSRDAGLLTSTRAGNVVVGTGAHGQIPETWDRFRIERRCWVARGAHDVQQAGRVERGIGFSIRGKGVLGIDVVFYADFGVSIAYSRRKWSCRIDSGG